mmetsp:Transcript_90919/g.294221  ORF Transcript_90919/g.294221 Transcript_90919/m.294221 type:complete len:197 (+) Transcript_90919:68-658(+)
MDADAASGQAAGWRSEAPLYGGAIVCDMPRCFSDASNFREVPDHQEVWVDGASDRSLIVEILERKDEVPDDQALAFFLSDLAAFNEAQEAAVLTSRPALMGEELPRLPADVRCFTGVGEQKVAKFKEACSNRVRVHMCAIRLAEQRTDILLTLNDPVSIDPQSSSGGLPVLQGAEEVFARVLRSFRIVDWDLFGES